MKLLEQTEYLCSHGAAEDVAKLVETGLPVKEEWVTGTKLMDSLLLSRMVDENDLSYELENALFSIANTAPWKHETRAFDYIKVVDPTTGKKKKIKDVDATRWPTDLRMRRCRLDAWASFHLAKHYYKELKQQRDLVVFTHRIASLLGRVSLAGAVVDLPKFEAMGAGLQTSLLSSRDALAKAAIAAGMESFSPTNDDDLRALLYEKLNLEVLATTGKKHLPAVDKQTLKQLEHPTVKLLLDFNKADKQYSVNVVGLRPLLHPCGRILGPDHETSVAWLPFRINPLGTKTGRRSSSDPNSQNWPPSVRQIIRSRWPGGKIADIDYRKLEAVLIGWVSGDDKLFTFFNSGRGYIDVASDLLGTEVAEGTNEYRGIKSIVLGVHYNMQTRKMARNLWAMGIRFSADYDTHEAEVDRLRRLYLRSFAGVGRYMEEREHELLAHGFVSSLPGRTRHLPVPDGKDTPGYHRMLNQAINFPIQSLASDVTGSAMVDAESILLELSNLSYVEYLNLLVADKRRYLTTSPLCSIITPLIEHSLLINEVHDSLVVDLYPPTAKRDLEIFVESMRSVKTLRKLCPGFDMPLNVDVKVGDYWGQKD